MKKITTTIQSLTESLHQEPLVSIIIPVYNTPEQYLRRCLDSAIGQIYKNLEIIIVDDGSTDDVVNVLKEYQKSDGRIRLLSGAHKGVSAARNLALREMHGEWFAFADADDIVYKGFIVEAVAIGIESQAELVVGQVQPIYRGTALLRNQSTVTYRVTVCNEERNELTRQMLSGYPLKSSVTPEFHGRGPVAKLYKTYSRAKLNFDESISISEDTLFNYVYLQYANSIAMAERTWYYYLQFDFSAAHSLDLVKFSSSLETISKHSTGEDFTVDCHARALYQVVNCMNNAIRGKKISYVSSEAKSIIEMGIRFGAFDPDIYKIYDIKPWVRILVYFCRKKNNLFASWYWKFFNVVKGSLKKRELFAKEGN